MDCPPQPATIWSSRHHADGAFSLQMRGVLGVKQKKNAESADGGRVLRVPSSLHLGAEESVDAGLIASSLAAIPFHYIVIDAQGEQLFPRHRLQTSPHDGASKHFRRQFRSIGETGTDTTVPGIPKTTGLSFLTLAAALSTAFGIRDAGVSIPTDKNISR